MKPPVTKMMRSFQWRLFRLKLLFLLLGQFHLFGFTTAVDLINIPKTTTTFSELMTTHSKIPFSTSVSSSSSKGLVLYDKATIDMWDRIEESKMMMMKSKLDNQNPLIQEIEKKGPKTRRIPPRFGGQSSSSEINIPYSQNKIKSPSSNPKHLLNQAIKTGNSKHTLPSSSLPETPLNEIPKSQLLDSKMPGRRVLVTSFGRGGRGKGKGKGHKNKSPSSSGSGTGHARSSAISWLQSQSLISSSFIALVSFVLGHR